MGIVVEVEGPGIEKSGRGAVFLFLLGVWHSVSAIFRFFKLLVFNIDTALGKLKTFEMPNLKKVKNSSPFLSFRNFCLKMCSDKYEANNTFL